MTAINCFKEFNSKISSIKLMGVEFNFDTYYGIRQLKDSVKKVSEKPYNICKDKSDYIKGEFVDNLDNIQKYSSIIMDQKYKDKELRNFDNKNLKCDFSLLKYISQDNCIYIEIN